MPTTPVDIVNRALDECGLPEIGDLTDGSDAAKAASRIYWPTLRQMLAGAHWNFARASQDLNLIGDRSGVLNSNQDVPTPWSYMYEWPVDCVHARFMPRLPPATTVPGVPIFTGPQNVTPTNFGWASPAPFLVGSVLLPNDPAGQWYLTEGHDPDQTKVILSDQSRGHLIYTKMMQYPPAWDALFEQAMVAALAARLAMPLIEDKKFAREVRADNIQIAKAALDSARVTDGDEGWNVQDHTPDWIRARTSGGAWSWSGFGVLGYGWCRVGWLEDAGGVY